MNARQKIKKLQKEKLSMENFIKSDDARASRWGEWNKPVPIVFDTHGKTVKTFKAREMIPVELVDMYHDDVRYHDVYIDTILRMFSGSLKDFVRFEEYRDKYTGNLVVEGTLEIVVDN